MKFERNLWLGFLTLALSGLPSLFFLVGASYPMPNLPLPRTRAVPIPPLSIQWDLSSDFSALSIGNARSQLEFSVDPPRPDSKAVSSGLLIRLNQSKQIKRVELPARVDLEFVDQTLQFSPSSRFWLACSQGSAGSIDAAFYYQTPEGEEVLNSQWNAIPQDTPIFSIEEFREGNPFRELSETRWWGHDIFSEKYGGGKIVHRLEIGAAQKVELIDCSFDDWLIYQEGRWQKAHTLNDSDRWPIAHIKSSSSQGLEIEGWDGSSHIRLRIPPAQIPPLKMKGEDLFTQLRVRSEKQVSCMFDKQCLILRAGDWVLKSQGRWKVLRKKEEKNAFSDRKIAGELFVLDRIDARGASKSVSGHYFAAGRSQAVPIDYVQKQTLHHLRNKK